jgi:hypothetical protein
MTDVYKDTMKEIYREAPPELVAGFRKKMGFIQDRFKHSHKTVQSCLQGMADPPPLVELLAAAYLVNGGLLFKHEDCSEDAEDDLEYSRLMKEMEELNCSSGPVGGNTVKQPAPDKPSSPALPDIFDE